MRGPLSRASQRRKLINNMLTNLLRYVATSSYRFESFVSLTSSTPRSSKLLVMRSRRNTLRRSMLPDSVQMEDTNSHRRTCTLLIQTELTIACIFHRPIYSLQLSGSLSLINIFQLVRNDPRCRMNSLFRSCSVCWHKLAMLGASGQADAG